MLQEIVKIKFLENQSEKGLKFELIDHLIRVDHQGKQ